MAKILLVDDDALLVSMYQKKLENDGYTVTTADGGDVALISSIGALGEDGFDKLLETARTNYSSKQ